jgi:hypothetical protein
VRRGPGRSDRPRPDHRQAAIRQHRREIAASDEDRIVAKNHVAPTKAIERFDEVDRLQHVGNLGIAGGEDDFPNGFQRDAIMPGIDQISACPLTGGRYVPAWT